MNHCGQCLHWHAHPIVPSNVTAARLGECRGGPPGVIAIPVGPGQMQVQAIYPVIPEAFPACALFALSLARLSNHKQPAV